ncbi:hypothetical protein [Mesorhizobium sp. M0768]|uniref:hypothetical protein n=1 Tax=Mesorhizobium sp. M0768 TaxID=2956996 RepID=UPI00333A68D3
MRSVGFLVGVAMVWLPGIARSERFFHMSMAITLGARARTVRVVLFAMGGFA